MEKPLRHRFLGVQFDHLQRGQGILFTETSSNECIIFFHLENVQHDAMLYDIDLQKAGILEQTRIKKGMLEQTRINVATFVRILAECLMLHSE